MNVCMTLCYAVGRGVQNVYGDLREKRALKQEKKLLRNEESDHEGGEAGRRPRRHVNSNQHDHDNQPEASPGSIEGPRVLGISSEARAAADAHGNRSMALVAGVRQARRVNLFDTRRNETEALPPPQYDASAPRLPNYDAVVAGGCSRDPSETSGGT